MYGLVAPAKENAEPEINGDNNAEGSVGSTQASKIAKTSGVCNAVSYVSGMSLMNTNLREYLEFSANALIAEAIQFCNPNRRLIYRA